ncbi:septation protein A [Undibacterium fentianense]|uniref:Inner membrane-spanning protein YciB n=1 Tax=Undibacterium fentianense TaxID=2828728 RepID=A0A941IDK2_9BURK|nr:septation protein A [Undibacterium fentianense]MBR7798661.1 septation protein A [Undibacterium fentianense]
MKLLFDLFPVLLFFLSYNRAEKNPEKSLQLANEFLSGFTSGHMVSPQMAPILIATAVAVVASILQILYLMVRRKKIDLMLWVSFFIVSVFGGLTIYFQNDTFVKIKLTIIYWLFAFGFAFSQYFLKKNFLKTMMGSEIKMPEIAWDKLNLVWIAYFLVMGAANLYVALTYSQSTWVSYKFYSFFALPVFVIGQTFFLMKYIEETK